MHANSTKGRLAFFLPSLRGGGAERVIVNVLHGLARRGFPLDLVLAEAVGPFLEQVPAAVRVIDLSRPRMRSAIRGLVGYLRREQPAALVSRMNHANLAAILARSIARTSTRVVIIEAIHATAELRAQKFSTLTSLAMRLLYPRADQIIAVSDGVARDLERHLRLSHGRVRTIYNPVVDESRLAAPGASAPHPWLGDRATPLFVAVGRLHPQKGFADLLHAFRELLRRRPARLLIYGEGSERSALEALARELQITNHVCLPGFTNDPYSAMQKAAAFVLSSHREGFPNALVEALACGCPAIATSCPSGPEEILAGGRYGFLVPVGDRQALATSMLRSIDYPWNRQLLRDRAAEFSIDRIVPQYISAICQPPITNLTCQAA